MHSRLRDGVRSYPPFINPHVSLTTRIRIHLPNPMKRVAVSQNDDNGRYGGQDTDNGGNLDCFLLTKVQTDERGELARGVEIERIGRKYVSLLRRNSMQALRHHIKVTYKHQLARRHLVPITMRRVSPLKAYEQFHRSFQ